MPTVAVSSGKYTCDKANSLIRKAFREILDPLYQTARSVPGGFNEVATGAILAGGFKDAVHLVEFTHVCAVEKMTPDVPFISIGSGKSAADSLLGLLAQVYWPDRSPTLEEAKLAAYWTVQHAIDMRVPGVSFGTELFILRNQKDQLVAEELDAASASEHAEFVESIRDAMRSAVDFSTEGAAPLPTMDNK